MLFRSTLKDDSIVHIDLNRPMKDILAELSRHPVTTRVSLTGPLIVARDIAILVSATGLGLGVFGSWLSVRSYLRA